MSHWVKKGRTAQDIGLYGYQDIQLSVWSYVGYFLVPLTAGYLNEYILSRNKRLIQERQRTMRCAGKISGRRLFELTAAAEWRSMSLI
jgi:hypothetical protein